MAHEDTVGHIFIVRAEMISLLYQLQHSLIMLPGVWWSITDLHHQFRYLMPIPIVHHYIDPFTYIRILLR